MVWYIGIHRIILKEENYRMKKLFLLFLFFSTGSYLHAMEQDLSSKSPWSYIIEKISALRSALNWNTINDVKNNDTTCYLALLPKEILALIGSYCTELIAPKKDSSAWDNHNRYGTQIKIISHYPIDIKLHTADRSRASSDICITTKTFSKKLYNIISFPYGLTQDGKYAWYREEDKKIKLINLK